MKRHIRIGYMGQNSSWEQLLGQIGVSWERLDPDQPVSIEHYSCVIADRSVDRKHESNLDQYLKNGGALIDAVGAFYPESVQSTSMTLIAPGTEDRLFGHIAKIPVYGRALTTEAGLLAGTVKIDPSPDRQLAFCGLPVHRLWQGYKSVHRAFGSKDTALTFERVAALRSQPYVEVLLTLLKLLHDKSGLPFVHAWWHPHSEKHAATWRVDTDFGDLNRMRELSSSASEFNIPLTWFLHTAYHGEQLPNLIDLLPKTDEVSLHCYRHFEYKTTAQYHSDILEGIKLLRQCGVDPKGYAGPYGSWSEPLARALSRFSFQYSSEFGYDYDSLPSMSPASGILQLPIHPVSIGSFRRFKAEISDVQSYFNYIIKMKRLTHQPLHLYHHPNDGERGQFKAFLQQPEYDNYDWMTYSEWYDWWMRRSAVNYVSVFDSETGRLQFTRPGTEQIPVAIHHQNKFQISVCHEKTLHLEELQFRPYIDSDLNTLIEKQNSESNVSWFRRTKDQWLTQLWRNRA